MPSIDTIGLMLEMPFPIHEPGHCERPKSSGFRGAADLPNGRSAPRFFPMRAD
jgi:hypothetical protein